MNLLKKEFRLCMHPTAIIMLGLCALVLTPGYPYAVSFFYMTLGIFFTCLSGRENHDALFTLSLPVSRRDMVRGRVLLACCLEIADIAVCGLFLLLRRTLMGTAPNPAGMDANVALLGEGFLLFSLFNILFFPIWYGDIAKVGKPFLIASAAVFLYIVAGIIATYALPFARDTLDTPDPEHLSEKLLFLALSAGCFLLCAALTVRLSAQRFEKLDL